MSNDCVFIKFDRKNFRINRVNVSAIVHVNVIVNSKSAVKLFCGLSEDGEAPPGQRGASDRYPGELFGHATAQHQRNKTGKQVFAHGSGVLQPETITEMDG